MISVKESIESQGKLHDFLSEMLHLFLADSVDLNQKVSFKDRQVCSLEERLGTIHSIDFKSQNESKTLRKEMLDI